MATAMLLAPTANAPYLTRLGNTYTADEYGVIRDVPSGTEVTDLQSMGCSLVQPGRYPIFALSGADMTKTTDQQFSSTLGPANWYSLSKVVITGATGPITSVVGGIYTQPEKGGEAVVADGQNFALDGATEGEMVVATLAPICATQCFKGPLYLSLSTPLSEHETCDIFVYGDVMAL
jgi:hypothetical protein